jgi:prophage DNA circulation protein
MTRRRFVNVPGVRYVNGRLLVRQAARGGDREDAREHRRARGDAVARETAAAAARARRRALRVPVAGRRAVPAAVREVRVPVAEALLAEAVAPGGAEGVRPAAGRDRRGVCGGGGG